MNTINNMMLNAFPHFSGAQMTTLALVTVWTLFWKGTALWHAGRRHQPVWFVILLLINTLGILEILYLFLVLKLKLSQLLSSQH
jgi:hypothetical protein